MTEEDLFLAVLDLPPESDWAGYLEKACGGNIALRQRVEALLAAHFKTGEFLDSPAHGLSPSDAATDPGEETEFDRQVKLLLAHHFKESSGTKAPLPAAADAEYEETPHELTIDLRCLEPSNSPGSLGRMGHYEVLQVLGQGGFGIVFRAFDDVLQRVVAVKMLAPQLAATSPARKRFLREARSTAQVRHENVVQVYATGERPLPYLVMEYIPGETLQQRIDRTGPFETPDVVSIARQMAEGLAAAHATTLIHRDVKPCNVLLESGPSSRVKITDFGLARAANDASMTQSGLVAGTPMYMAPEQAKGESLDHRADLFSLGSVLYVMVTGRPPFRAATGFGVMKRVVEDAPRPIHELIPETPQWLVDIITKLHAKNKEDRFQSALEVVHALSVGESKLVPDASRKSPAPVPIAKPVAVKLDRRKWVLAAVLLVPVLGLAVMKLVEKLPALTEQQQQPGSIANTHLTPMPHVPKDKGPPTDFANTLEMKFKLIPAGKFKMGSLQEEIDYWLNIVEQEGHKLFLRAEAPEHDVEITRPFYMGVTEVTVAEFRQFVEANPKYVLDEERWKDPGFKQTDECPVVWISWRDATEFCVWLSKKEGKKYRLPTEAEWEYACRAGTTTRYSFGNDEAQLEDYAWVYKNSNHGSKPVARKKPNSWGLYDMHGNAWEWCQDYHDPNYYELSPRKDPTGPNAGQNYVKRGGAWCFGSVDARSTYRSHTGGGCECGFRVLLEVPPHVQR